LENKSGATVAKELLKIFFDFGFPKIIQSDNGKEFVNAIVKEITSAAGIDHRLITPYHPQANGSAERTVQTAKRLILKLINGVKKDWDLFVPFTQFCINAKIVKRHKSSPFTVMFGRATNKLTNYQDIRITPSSSESEEKRIEIMQTVLFPAIKDATQVVTEAIKRAYDKNKLIKELEAGTYVMIMDKERKSKQDPANEGPYKIIHKTTGGSYILQDLEGKTLSRNYSINELIVISESPIFDDQSYEIEKILNHRLNDNHEYEYLTKWKNYDETHNTWEPFENFDSQKIIEGYWEQQRRLEIKNSSDLAEGDVVLEQH